MASRILYLPQVWLGSQLSTRFLPSSVNPLAAHIKFTENCQARCISCNYWKSRRRDPIDTERAVDILNQVDTAGIRSLRLTGGEPLLRKDLFEVLREARTSRFKKIILQTNGLLIRKLHKQINESPITHVCVSVDGLENVNDRIRGIRGYFRLAFDGIRSLQGKKVALSVTLNRLSAGELKELASLAKGAGASVEINLLSRSLFFLKDADIATLWPERRDAEEISSFLRETLGRPEYEVDYISRYYQGEALEEPPCVLGFLQVFVLSNGDVLTGCYPLKPVGNLFQDSLGKILASKEYVRQSTAMIRRECPGCTCGIESSLAMKHAASSACYFASRAATRE